MQGEVLEGELAVAAEQEGESKQVDLVNDGPVMFLVVAAAARWPGKREPGARRARASAQNCGTCLVSAGAIALTSACESFVPAAIPVCRLRPPFLSL